MKKQLKNITIVSYNCINPIQSAKALLYSSKDIDFAEMILVSNTKPDNLPTNIKFVYTEGKTHNDSSKYAYQQLPDLIQTDFYLGIHDDGFVINPHLWDDNFLNYDYIGAPWNNYGQRNRVGNGGFCLRSKKFLNLCKNIKYLGGHEDGELTNQYYDYFTHYGCRYAPVEVAMKFSLEERIPECEFNLNNTFGFHGRGDPYLDPSRGHYQQFLDKIKLLESIQLFS